MKTRLPARLTLPVIFGVALATGFSGAVVPGSLLAVVVRESVRVGWQAGPLTTGLIKFARSDRARGLIGVIGGGVLLYLGYSTLGLSGEAAAEALRAGAAPSGGAGAWAPGSVLRLAALGALMSTVNPYWWLWWATIGVAHVGWATGGGRPSLGGATYFVGHVLSDFLWYCAVGVTLAAGRTLFSPPVWRGVYLEKAGGCQLRRQLVLPPAPRAPRCYATLAPREADAGRGRNDPA